MANDGQGAADAFGAVHADVLRERRKVEAFASLSHEIRTLLTGVLGCTTLLLDTELSTEQRDYAKRIRASGDALLSLVNNILDFTKIEAGRLTVADVDLDARRVVEEVGELLAERAGRAGLELVVAVDSAMPSSLRGDPGRLRQVLLNLVSNALKFTERGEVVVRAGPTGDGEVVTVRFEVADTGPGISAEGRARLFTPFSQADRAEAGQLGGSGLGLAISKGLVEAMGGAIACESEPGHGSTFWFAVPFRRRVGNERGAIPRTELSGRSALVAVPNAAARAVVREALEALELRAAEVATGAAALEALEVASRERQLPDVVLVDARLPDMDGLTLARTLRADEASGALRVVVLGYPGEVGLEARGSVAALLAKPVRPSRLAACVKTLLGTSVERVERLADRARPGPSGDVVPPASPFPPPPGAGERPRVLVVEDNVVNQKVAVFLIGKRGYAVDVVEDGLAGVEAASRGGYVAVFMDCQMPRFDGFQATAKIRQLEAGGSRVPIIAMTANVGDDARERCISAGMDDYLSKPMVPDDLDRVLGRWCPRAGASASSVQSMPVIPLTSEPPSMPPPTLDGAALASLRSVQREGEPDIVTEVVELFGRDAPERVKQIRDATAGGDLVTASRAAHTLKAAAGHVGARALAALCKRFEQEAKGGAPPAQLLAMCADLDAALGAACRALAGATGARGA